MNFVKAHHMHTFLIKTVKHNPVDIPTLLQLLTLLSI